MKLSFDPVHWQTTQTNAHPDVTDQSDLNARIHIVFEDHCLLVVDKPAGLLVQSDKQGTDHLLALLTSQRPQEKLYLVHRLDRPVSGLVILAKSAFVQTQLTRQMMRRDFVKTYWAIVQSNPEPSSGILEHHLIKDETQNKSRAVDSGSVRAKFARLSYRTISHAIVNGRSISWLEIRLETGRHHQIRAQLAESGWPILGDRKYGGTAFPEEGTPAPIGIALLARTVRLIHPVLGQEMIFEAEPPDSFPWKCFASVTQDPG